MPTDEAVDTEDRKAQEAAIAKLAVVREKITSELGKVIIGQGDVIEQILIAFFARGHCLLIGVPGLGKTLLVKTLAASLDLRANRIQFTPDLMPADITGTDILEENASTGRRTFRFNPGPIFANMLLADEINRTPPKTQAALLEAMQEQQITVSGTCYELPKPFMVLATQNPIELEGTYPLPEAQLDRFMFCVNVDYPDSQHETQILMETTRDSVPRVEKSLGAAELINLQELVRQVPVTTHVADYASSIVRATRPGRPEAPDFVNQWVRWGAGTRAGQYLLLAAKAHVLFSGRYAVSCADVRKHALPVLRHRIFRNFSAASDGITADTIVGRILEQVKEPSY